MPMQVIYAGEEFPKVFRKSIFLAGPTPRSQNVTSWRPEALKILEFFGYDGVVMVPERRDAKVQVSYDSQLDWESRGLNLADCILFWIPREMTTLPALTTNVEYGEWMRSGKVVLGAPESAASVRYLQLRGAEYFIPQSLTLDDTVAEAVRFVGDGALRKNGECQVPLYIWKTESFRSWYGAQLRAGNRLDGARVEWNFRVGPQKKFIFLWVIKANVYVAREQRNKVNEVVLSRPDVSSVLLYRRGETLADTEVVLVREFRSPASTPDGYIWELPGGSSRNNQAPNVVAAEEVREETGFEISPERIRCCEARQLAGTFSAHKAQLFAAEINQSELDWFKSQAGIVHGLVQDSECTYVEVLRIDRIMNENLVDWSTLGMILSTLAK